MVSPPSLKRRSRETPKKARRETGELLDGALERASQITEAVGHLRLAMGLSYRAEENCVYSTSPNVAPSRKRSKANSQMVEKETCLDASLTTALVDLLDLMRLTGLVELNLPPQPNFCFPATDSGMMQLCDAVPQPNGSSEDELTVAEALITMSNFST